MRASQDPPVYRRYRPRFYTERATTAAVLHQDFSARTLPGLFLFLCFALGQKGVAQFFIYRLLPLASCSCIVFVLLVLVLVMIIFSFLIALPSLLPPDLILVPFLVLVLVWCGRQVHDVMGLSLREDASVFQLECDRSRARYGVILLAFRFDPSVTADAFGDLDGAEPAPPVVSGHVSKSK